MRRSHYINKLMKSDEKMLHAFRSVGYLTREMLKEHLRVADRRIENFCRDHYLEKCSFIDSRTQQTIDVYRLSKKGQELCREQLRLDSFYSSKVFHDLALAEKYFSLSESERVSWKTESELRQHFREQSEELNKLREEGRDQEAEELENCIWEKVSAIDASYVNDEGIEQGIEVITNNYGEAEVTAKSEFAQRLGIQLQFVKA